MSPERRIGVSLRRAEVFRIESAEVAVTRLTVRFTSDGEPEPAIAYNALTPEIKVGDQVLVNTTAVELGLGTGGVHFVLAAPDRELSAPAEGGHIMKLRYTPLQFKVLAAEEQGSPVHDLLTEIPDLAGKPVLVGSLHSMAPIAAAGIKAYHPGARVAYVMTDGAALPAAFSRLVGQMKATRVVDGVITAGHAFGGDLETVTPAAAIAAAHAALNADAIVVAMGPGVVGTATPLGTTALEQGPLLDAAGALGGAPIAIPRLSGADPRERHRGISHHTVTALTRFTHVPAFVPLPRDTAFDETLKRQAAAIGQAGRRIVWEDGEAAYQAAKGVLERAKINVTTMGRGDREDPLFFYGAASAAKFAAERM